MNQSPDITNVKKEITDSTTNCRMDIPNEELIKSIKEEQSPDITNAKKVLTDSTCRMEIPNEEQIKLIKEENNCLVQSENSTEAKTHEKEGEFRVIDNSYKICPSFTVKEGTDEPMIKLEYVKKEITDDPMHDNGEVKITEHFPINLNVYNPCSRTEPIREEIHNIFGKHFLDSDIQGCRSNNQVTAKSIEHITSRVENTISNDDVPENKGRNNENHLPQIKRKRRYTKKYVCHLCLKKFIQRRDLDRHFFIHTGERPFICFVCKKTFNLESTLGLHMLTHTGEKPYACDVCQRPFRYRSGLRAHKMIHTGQRPFTCNLCDKSFSRRAQLTRHRRLHTGEKPYSCEICNKTFTRKQGLLKHGPTHKS